MPLIHPSKSSLTTEEGQNKKRVLARTLPVAGLSGFCNLLHRLYHKTLKYAIVISEKP